LSGKDLEMKKVATYDDGASSGEGGTELASDHGVRELEHNVS
jgi:hypothetical protein